LVGAIVFVHLPMLPVFLVPVGHSLYLCQFLTYALVASVPFLLAELAPRAAAFDAQWSPKGWKHYVGILVPLLLVFASNPLAQKLTTCFNLGSHRPYFIPTLPGFSRLTIAFDGLLFLVAAPVAEEIFWRGYVLDQLRKLTHWTIALPLHALLFALGHLIFYTTFSVPLAVFLHALVVGAWRIRFKALLPLILIHGAINVAGSLPTLHREYQILRKLERTAPDLLAAWNTNPKCQQIASLTRLPAARAVPALIAFLNDGNKNVQNLACWAITTYRSDDVQPCLGKALASTDKGTVDEVLFLIQICHCRGLREEVRRVAWSSDDRGLQISAMVTLLDLDDTDGLKEIAEKHQDKKVRGIAEHILKMKKQPPSK
jgi:membrane protease YdiL (CAAX protease family)